MTSLQHASTPVIAITGGAGRVGRAMAESLSDDYRIIVIDQPGTDCDIEMDLTEGLSVTKAISELSSLSDGHVACVIHLAAYFNFDGKASPLYEAVNVKGTQTLLDNLAQLKVERFLYLSTMLVHEAASPGQRISESSPLKPAWAYPESKLRAEEVIRQHEGRIPYAIIRLAGLYDDETAVPTLAQQIARIYEQDVKSFVYAGDKDAGQAFIHAEDMLALIKEIIGKRDTLDQALILLAGEEESPSYQTLQNHIGAIIHGEQAWTTLNVPSAVAKAGAWVQEKTEPVVPDALDEGERPFIKPFMVDLASDHYELNLSALKSRLDWRPKHRLLDELEALITNLKKNPLEWYRANGIHPPVWMQDAPEASLNAEQLRVAHESNYRAQHLNSIWAYWVNMALGLWLMTSPVTVGVTEQSMVLSDMVSGVLLILFSGACLSRKRQWTWSRWASAGVGVWLLAAPLVFWTESAAAYLNNSLVGCFVIGFALAVRPEPGVTPIASQTGPEIPPGWDFSPSDWFQRIPIIVLALFGFIISRYMAAYQLGHIDAVWDPFFAGASPNDGRNGTEEIITSDVSEAWPVPDAGLGAMTYALEIVTGLIGSRARWRTMPWLVLLFGFMIVPLGAISITFIIIQPVLLGTWCTLCLIAAAAMLIQIPYSFDEIVATIDFLRRRHRAGRPWIKVVFTGDTVESIDDQKNKVSETNDSFLRPPLTLIKEMLSGGVSVTRGLAVSMAIGIWLLCTRLTLGTEGHIANADHILGALIITVSVTALAEVMRPVRFLNICLGIAVFLMPFILGASTLSMVFNSILGLLLIVSSLERGSIHAPYGAWSRYLV